jgi:heme A synthase
MWLAIDLGVLAALIIFALVHLARRRDDLERRRKVKWVLAILFVPIAGVVGYYFSLLDKAVARGTPGRRDSAAPFLQKSDDR